MSPKMFIFIGRSGCGKGTQARLLEEYLKKEDPGREIFYLETGQRFRDFIKEDNLSSKLSLAISQEEKLQPSFLAVWMWSHLLIENLNGDEHIISDGTPRSIDEARVLDSAIRFYNRVPAYVVYLDVSRNWAEKRLQSRGRADDQHKDGIKKRLDWFETSVLPAVEHLREHPEYLFLDINGERPMEEVHQEIIKKIELQK